MTETDMLKNALIQFSTIFWELIQLRAVLAIANSKAIPIQARVNA